MRLRRSHVILGAVTFDRDALMRQAFGLLRARGLSPAEAQAGAAIGWFESWYGTRPPFLLSTGEPSWNFGATTARKGVPSFGGSDHDKDGNPITQRWARWGSMAEGVDYWIDGFGSVRAALPRFAEGNAVAGAAEMYDRGYYSMTSGTREDRIRGYARAIVDTARLVANATGTPLLLNRDGAVPPKASGPIPAPPKKRTREGSSVAGFALLAVVPLGWYALRKAL